MAAGSSSAAASRSNSAAGIQGRGSEEGHSNSRDILSVINSLKKKITSDRMTYIKERIGYNGIKLNSFTQIAYNQAISRGNSKLNYAEIEVNLLTTKQGAIELAGIEKESSSQGESSAVSSSVGGSFGGRNDLKLVKLPEVEKLPAYSTWIFLDRNQRMSEDQSVVGRRRIYYDRSCGEALICSDSEDEAVEDDGEKKEFSDIEDYIIRMTVQEIGMSDSVLDVLGRSLEKNADMIKARYEFLTEEKSEGCRKEDENDMSLGDVFLERDVDAALDSFDNLFCRRCLVFDCRLHGCSQDLIFPCEKQPPLSHQEDMIPCGLQCYKLASTPDNVVNFEVPVVEDLTQSSISTRKKQPSPKSQRASPKRKDQDSESGSNSGAGSESNESGVHPAHHIKSFERSASPTKVRVGNKCEMKKSNNKRTAEQILASMKKRQKEQLPSKSNSITSGSTQPRDLKLTLNAKNGNKNSLSSNQYRVPCTRSSTRKGVSQSDDFNATSFENRSDLPSDTNRELIVADADESQGKEIVGETTCKQAASVKSWTVMEQGLFVKGLEIFGRNSCLVARNLLGGLKTCREVFNFMNYVENNGESGFSGSTLLKALMKGNDSRSRTRFFRRRGKVRRLKYTWKSAGYHFIRKRITEKKDQPCRQYNPCGCQSSCGKQCPCLVNGTCCEKYCGCSKICKNRFRGCHCAKSQCRSRQCPCFAADRECDPDVCKSCWVGCGDGTLGGPVQRGDNYECRNMKLLLKQQQRVLLGKSDVSGWGAFSKNSVGKHEYLGEYTGELISHREADKRGKIYDRENSSFLFNLNNQFVLDAQRMGDKLKFANHSPDPNCYAKVIMVAGDHRVGIFAKERIAAGEELFYDYRYEPDRAPAWARKADASGVRDDSRPSAGRAKKLA